MTNHALIEHRPWLALSVAAAVAFYFLSDNAIGDIWKIAIKGTAVGALALYALRRTRGIDGAILTLALALAAGADMALEIDFMVGGVLFFAAHLFTIGLFLRNRAETLRTQMTGVAIALVIATPAISYVLSNDVLIAIYAAGLGMMAALAWCSRFPIRRVGVGAMLFVVSDWLIFSRFGTIDLGVLPDLLVWPTYYAAQLLIATGVVQTLRGELGAN